MRIAILLSALVLAGCVATPRVELQTINIAVPVECREPMPERPTMPSEQLAPGTDVFELLRAAMATRSCCAPHWKIAPDHCRNRTSLPGATTALN